MCCNDRKSTLVDAQLYRVLFDHYLHQDNLYWSMLQHFITLQIVILSAFFILKDEYKSILFLLMVLAIIFNNFLKKIILKTYIDRASNYEKMRSYEKANDFSLTELSGSAVGSDLWKHLFNLFLCIYILIIIFLILYFLNKHLIVYEI